MAKFGYEHMIDTKDMPMDSIADMNVCLIGCGGIGSLHLEVYQSLGCSVSVVETDPDKVTLLASKQVPVYASIDEVIVSHHDLYDVCLPTHHHAKAVEVLLKQTSSKILCEKPLTLTSVEAKQLYSTADATTRLLCAFVERFNHPFELIKQWTDSHPGPYELTLKRRTKKPRNAPWFGQPELGGDVVLDLGIHDIDLAIWLTNSTCTEILNHQASHDDHENFELLFADGSRSKHYSGWDLPQDHQFGIENYVSLRTGDDSITYNSDTETITTNHDDRTVTPRFPAAYYKEIEAALAFTADLNQRQFPSADTVVHGLDIFEKIKARRHTT